MPKKLRVLEGMDVYLPDTDGVINALHNYSLNLYKRVDLTVMAPKHRGHIDNQAYRIIRCRSLRVPIIDNYYGLPSRDSKFKQRLLREDYDIIHIHSPFAMLRFGLKLARKKGIPIVATFHSDMRTIFKSMFFFNWIVNALVNRIGKLYNQVDEVFCISSLVEEQLRSYGYTGKVTYLPYGTDFARSNKVEELWEEGNQKFDLENEETLFIFVGRIMKLKRIDFILESLKIVKENGYKFKFKIVGKGPETRILKRKVKELKLENEVCFLGFIPREDFPALYARGDLLLFPSLYDNFGLVKVEAAAFATAGLFIENSCAGDGIIDGVNGYLAANNPEAFERNNMEAIKDKEKLRQVGLKAWEDVYISWDECSQQLLKRLEAIVLDKKAQKEKVSA